MMRALSTPLPLSLSLSLPLLAAVALGCGASPPSAANPAASSGSSAAARGASASPGSPALGSPSIAQAGAATGSAPRACGPRIERTVKASSRAGSSVALVQFEKRSLVFVADEENRAVHVLDAEGPTELAVTELPGKPAQLLALPDGRVLATLRDTNRLAVLELGARPEDGLERRCERATYTEPFGVALSKDGARVAVTAGWDHKLMLLDAADLTMERSIDLAPEPRGVLLSDDGDTAYVAHMVGGILSSVSLSDVLSAPKRTFLRPERPAPKAKKAAASAPKEPDKTQELAAAQGFALAEISLGSDGGRPWPARVLIPLASSDPMRFSEIGSFPGVYGGGGGGPAVIGAFVAVFDPKARAPLGGEVAPLREARPEDCILPRGVAVHQGRLLVACLGINAVVELDARAVDPITAERRRFRVGEGPTGIAVDAARERALVFSQWSGELSIIDLADPAKTETRALKLARPEAPALSPKLARGRALFHVTRDVRMSFDGRACVSCHPDGRADGLTWATPDGPRQTISLAGRVEGSGPFGWFGDHPTAKSHVMFTVSRLGGLGFQDADDKEDLDALMAYVAALPTPSRQGALVDGGVLDLRARGRDLFHAAETGCATCHLGPSGDGRRHDVGSGDAREKRLSFDTPGLRFIGGSAPYFHDGRYPTLMDLLSDPNSKMGRSAHLSEADRRALAAYLESL